MQAGPGYGVGQLADQFGQMGMGGQKQHQLLTTNLLTAPPDPNDLNLPPPEIRLPPGASLSPMPTTLPDPSYQRSTINAVPTTSSLLSKSKLPFALILAPYRSLNEGEEPVPLVTDTVIARCRRCRTYMNPYVQFIDGGNRCVPSLSLLFCNSPKNMISQAGDAVCVTCRTRYPNYSTGIKRGISQAIVGLALSSTTLWWNLLLLLNT
jgi:hypothetical protein